VADVLNQDEINALLSALSSGELTAEEIRKEDQGRRIRAYDFKRAMRFSKDQIRSIVRIFENFARLLTTYLSAQLRTFVQISVVSVDQVPYEEFILSIPTMTILSVFDVYPLDGKFIMEINPDVGFAMLDRLLGGIGAGGTNVRPLTEIELTVLERICIRALDYFRDAWKGISDLEPQMDLLEVNPQFLQIVSANETTAVVSLSIKIGDTGGMINVCMPHVVLEPIMPKLSAHYLMDTKNIRENAQQVESLRSRLVMAPVPIVAELGVSEISVSELLGLGVGDVITLDQQTAAPIAIRVAGELKYEGRPGIVKGKLAIQITDILVEGMDEE